MTTASSNSNMKSIRRWHDYYKVDNTFIENNLEDHLRIFIKRIVWNNAKVSQIPYHRNVWDILGCNRLFFTTLIEYQFNYEKEISWESFGITWEFRLLIPTNYFNLTRVEQLYYCFNWSNIIPELINDNITNTILDPKKYQEAMTEQEWILGLYHRSIEIEECLPKARYVINDLQDICS